MGPTWRLQTSNENPRPFGVKSFHLGSEDLRLLNALVFAVNPPTGLWAPTSFKIRFNISLTLSLACLLGSKEGCQNVKVWCKVFGTHKASITNAKITHARAYAPKYTDNTVYLTDTRGKLNLRETK